MRRMLVLIGVLFISTLTGAQAALALSCPASHVVWVEAYNSSDGSYKRVSWQGGTQYFSGTGTDYVNTGRRTNSFADVESDSSTKWTSQFCVPVGVESP